MGKSSKRNIAEVEADTYESDDGFVSNDDGKAPKSKKTKKEKQPGRKEKDGSNNKFWTVRLSSTVLLPLRVLIVIALAFVGQNPSESRDLGLQGHEAHQHTGILREG
jgi:hypothetical protein